MGSLRGAFAQGDVVVAVIDQQPSSSGPGAFVAPTPRTQAEQVRVALETAIISGELAPGAVIDENKTADRYGVSRTPVREAILTLVQAGLVTKQARQPAKVTHIDTAQFLHMFEAIGELEGLTARLATRRMTPAEKDALARLHESAGEALRAGDRDAYDDFGKRFHGEVVLGCKNQTLIDMTTQLAARLRPFRRFQVRAPGRHEANQAEHGLILEAIVAGDDDRAYRLMRSHGKLQGDSLIDYIAVHGGEQQDRR